MDEGRLLGKRITVTGPTTTANLGPGFDCLGMALDLWSEVQVKVGEVPRVVVQGWGCGRTPRRREQPGLSGYTTPVPPSQAGIATPRDQLR